MALIKQIKQDNGLTLNYHRIMYVDSMINKNIAVIVASYPDKDTREYENGGKHIYHSCETYNHEYVENFTVKDAYDFLKTLEVFDGAEDA